MTEPLQCVLTLPDLTTAQAMEYFAIAAGIYATVWGARFIVRSISKGR